LIGLGAAAEDDLTARAGHHGEDEEHDHDDFDSFILQTPPLASAEAVRGAVQRALAVPGVLRVKGYAAVAGKTAPLIVQGVGQRVEAAFARPGSSQAPGLVVIGLQGLDRSAVAAALAA
jgi:cobalamin biosynthesis protein CobW